MLLLACARFWIALPATAPATAPATVAGAVAGAVAGNAIQNRAQANNNTYSLTVRMNDGRSVVVQQGELGGIREGSYVRVYNGRAWLR